MKMSGIKFNFLNTKTQPINWTNINKKRKHFYNTRMKDAFQRISMWPKSPRSWLVVAVLGKTKLEELWSFNWFSKKKHFLYSFNTYTFINLIEER